MTFEVNDLVRVIAINETGRVAEKATESIDGKMRYVVSLSSCKFPMRYSDDELELVEHYHKSKYKVGDRVRLTSGILEGTEGTLITRINAYDWSVCLNNGCMMVKDESRFEYIGNTDNLDETLSAEEIYKCIEDCADKFATIVHKGERYNPSEVDGIIKSFTEQIRVAYERGYKDGNFDGQEYAYKREYEDARRDFSNSVKRYEVCVGDEVVLSDSDEPHKGVITNVNNEENVCAYIDECGRFGVLRGDDIFNHLTGRKFPAIGDVLAELKREDIKEDENGQACK